MVGQDGDLVAALRVKRVMRGEDDRGALVGQLPQRAHQLRATGGVEP